MIAKIPSFFGCHFSNSPSAARCKMSAFCVSPYMVDVNKFKVFTNLLSIKESHKECGSYKYVVCLSKLCLMNSEQAIKSR